MKFGVFTHAEHKLKENYIFSYEPYVREMNLWLKNVDEVKIVAPISTAAISPVEDKLVGLKMSIQGIPIFNILGIKPSILTIFKIPIIIFKIFKVMYWADHIHLRCPGNVGLLGCCVQIFFPSKPKTAKYAGNWDPKSKQPISYRLQKWILSNTFLTRNMKVLVYGKWDNQSSNIIPFFTASYFENEKEGNILKELNSKINFIFVGALSKGKQPLLSVKIVEELKKRNHDVELNLYGDGDQRKKILDYISSNSLKSYIFLKGNQSKKNVKKAFQKSHFLIFISKSEGWPKVVAEAMFWSCLPISTNVSCVPFMLGHGKRGAVVDDDLEQIVGVIENYLSKKEVYLQQVNEARKWSQKYTLDKFSTEIEKVLKI